MMRLYLDTGALALIADCDASPPEIQRLLDSVQRNSVVLLISVGHLFDIARGDEPTRARVAAAIDLFPSKAVAFHRPQQHERAGLAAALSGDVSVVSPEPRSLPLRSFASWADFLRREGIGPEQLDQMAQPISLFGEAKNQSFDFRREHADPPEMAAILPQILSAMAQVSSAEDLMARLAHLFPDPSAARAWAATFWPIFEASKAQLAPIAAERGVSLENLLLKLQKRPEAVGADLAGIGVKGGYDRWLEVARDVAPGTWLSALLVKANVRNERRRPGMGDSADHEHAAHLPYVDVATVDAHNHAVLHPALKQRPDLQVRLLKNPTRDFAEVVEAMDSATAERT